MHACCCMKLMCGTKKGGGLAPMSNVHVKFLSPLRVGRWEEKEAAKGWCTLCPLRTERICPSLEDMQITAITTGPGLSPAEPTKRCGSLCSKSCSGSSKDAQGGKKKASCTSSRSICLIVFIPQLTWERGKREKKEKSKKQRRRNSSVEAISGWEWERVSALMSSLAAWEGNRLLSV